MHSGVRVPPPQPWYLCLHFKPAEHKILHMTIVDGKVGPEQEPDQDRNLDREEFSAFVESLPRWNVRVEFRQDSSPNGLVGSSDIVFFNRLLDPIRLSEDGTVRLQNRVSDMLTQPEGSYFYNVGLSYPEDDPSRTIVSVVTDRWPSPKMVQDLVEVEVFLTQLESGGLI